MQSAAPRRVVLRRLLTEPTLHFVVLAAMAFWIHRAVVGGDARVIVIDPAVKDEIAQRFRDHNGRTPTTAELERAVTTWKREEALYREALREHLERHDPTVRTALADRVRARAALAIRTREPSQAELDKWLTANRKLYETPQRYRYEDVAFSKADPRARNEVEKYQAAIGRGADIARLGRPISGGSATGDQLDARFGSENARRIRQAPIGAWQRIETERDVVLIRVNEVAGGLPAPTDLRRRLIADWSFAEEQRAVDEAVNAIVARYRFEERP